MAQPNFKSIEKKIRDAMCINNNGYVALRVQSTISNIDTFNILRKKDVCEYLDMLYSETLDAVCNIDNPIQVLDLMHDELLEFAENSDSFELETVELQLAHPVVYISSIARLTDEYNADKFGISLR